MNGTAFKGNLEEALWLTENLPIRLFGDPILRTKCQSVTKKELSDGSAQKWANEMVNFLKTYRKKTGAGRGLAANQLGIAKRMILVWLEDEPKIFINPKITSSQGKGVYPESCISAATLIIGEVTRPWTATFEYLNLSGEKQTLSADPMNSRLLFHEVDHLNGIVCADKYNKGTIKIAGGGAQEVLKPKLKQIR